MSLDKDITEIKKVFKDIETYTRFPARFIKNPIKENILVQNVISKSHDYPIGLFWYDIENDSLDYEPFVKGMYHTDTKGYEKNAKNPLVLRGRVFKDGDKNYIIVYPSDFKSFNFAIPKLPSLLNKVSADSNLLISGIVDEGGSNLLERKKI
jgi:hypothetical protein